MEPAIPLEEGGWCGHQDFIRLHVLGMEGFLPFLLQWGVEDLVASSGCFWVMFDSCLIWTILVLYYVLQVLPDTLAFGRDFAGQSVWLSPCEPYNN